MSPKPDKKKRDYKPKLGIFELNGLVEQHKDSLIFITNRQGEPALESWLKELRFQQALTVARRILDRHISEGAFQKHWVNTPDPKPSTKPAHRQANTATFGGYRNRRRAALHRSRKGQAPKERRW